MTEPSTLLACGLAGAAALALAPADTARSDAALSATVTGTRSIDGYGAIASNTPFGAGQKLLVTVTFTDGGKATALAAK